jgi:YHS domain-containing protein
LNALDWTGAPLGSILPQVPGLGETMTAVTRRALLAATLIIGTTTIAHAKSGEIYTGLLSSTAVGGYDPVAYFTDGKPVAGKASITHQWKGATWRFASEKNRDLFKAEPARYAPQYGGYCAWAVSQGYTAKGDPNYWKVVDGKLYLNYDATVQRNWEKDVPGHIANANRNWPKVLEK